MLRLLHIGLGPLGRMIVADAARRRFATVVHAVDTDPAMAGKTISQVVPESGFDGSVVPSLERVDRRSIDAAVVTTSSDLARCEKTLRGVIDMGLPIVSTCEELLYPWLRHAALADSLHAACTRTGARLLGTGVNPGFVMDALPVAATAVCRSVRSVKVWRIQDASTRRVPFQKKIGAGLDDSQFAARVADGSLRHVGLGESIHFIARYLGFAVARWDETIEPVRSDRDLSCALGPIPRGRIAGVRQIGRAWSGVAGPQSSPVIELDFIAAVGQRDPHDRVVLDADPPIDLTIKGGVHGDVATSAITLNAIPALMAAPPGLHTMATVPLVHCATPKP